MALSNVVRLFRNGNKAMSRRRIFAFEKWGQRGVWKKIIQKNPDSGKRF